MKLQRLAEVGSTNDVLREQARAGAREWTALIAERQTHGRGREGRAWSSPPGNLFLSVLLRPSLPVSELGLLPLLAGVAVAEACIAFGAEARLKWPNDVVVGERKLAGILVEAVSSHERAEFVVAGVGLNLRAVAVMLPEELQPLATSLEDETGRAYDPEDAARAIIERMRVWYHRHAAEGAGVVLEAWRGLSVAWWGRAVEVTAAGSRVQGRATGIDASGALLLTAGSGETLRIVAGDARALRLSGSEG
jgi:BirA family biotin operon repressor/biotin-[acetyl-CoA-carboxylase] ligase